MDILINGMEMPSCCGLCSCFHAEHPMYCQADKTIRMTAPYGKRMEGCPLVALPEHHGRLIDADALIKKTRMWSLVRGDEYFELRVNNAIVKELLEAVPTIVEASNGTDN